LLPSGSQVLYSNICNDVHLNLLVSFKVSGFESDLVILEQLPDPSVFGFSNYVVLQWWTEFFSPPDPALLARYSPTGLADTDLDFGAMKMLRGKAFLAGSEGGDVKKIPVMKQWVTIDGRTFLIEQVPLDQISSDLATLPIHTAAIKPRPMPGRAGSRAPDGRSRRYGLCRRA